MERAEELQAGPAEAGERPAPRWHFVASLASLAGGTAIGQGLVVLASPLISRQYGPAELGAFGVFSTLALLLNTVNSLRYEMAIPVAKDEDAAGDLLALCGALLASFCLLLSLGLWAFGEKLCAILKVPAMASYLWLLPLTVGVAGSYEALNFLSVRRKHFGTLAQARVVQGAAQSGLQILLGFFQAGALGLALGDFTGRAFSAARMAWGSGIGDILARFRWARLRSVAVEFARFPKFMAGATLLNIAGIQAPFLLIPMYFGPEQAGHYFIAYRTLFLPSSFIGAAISQVFLGEAAERARGGESMGQLTSKIFVLLSAAYLPLYTASLAGAGLLFPLVFGSRWEQAGLYAQILAPMTLVWSLARPISGMLLVRDRLKESLAFTVAELGGLLAAILLGAASGSMVRTAFFISGFGLLTSLASVGRFLHAAEVDYRVTLRRFGTLAAFNVPLGLGVWRLSRTGEAGLTLAASLLGVALVGLASRRYLKQEGLL